MIFISGYEHPIYNDMLTIDKYWQLKTIETTTRNTTGKQFARRECVWTNEFYCEGLVTQEVNLVFIFFDVKINDYCFDFSFDKYWAKTIKSEISKFTLKYFRKHGVGSLSFIKIEDSLKFFYIVDGINVGECLVDC
jgi:hypothetical protein